MVVLEHDHRREVVSVSVDSTDEHAILFHKSKAGSRLASACDDSGEAIACCGIFDLLGPITNEIRLELCDR